MKHPEIRAHLSAFLERDLDPEERSQIQTHLESCAACSSELRELGSTVSLLRRLPEPGHPPGLADAVMARVARDAHRPARVIQLLRRAAEPRFAAALAAGVAGLFLLVDGGDPVRSTAPTANAPIGVLAHDAALPSRPDAARPVRTGVVSNATPPGVYDQYARRARIQEFARLLRGAGHPYSDSLASHFEERSTVATADWHPR